MRDRSSVRTLLGGLALASLAILIASVPASAQRPWGSWLKRPPPVARPVREVPKPLRRLVERMRQTIRPLTISSIAAATATAIDEIEPNDSLETAQLIAFGDTVNGTIDSSYDVDYFAVDLTAGTALDFHVVRSAGSQLNPYIAVIAPDSTLLGLAYPYADSGARVVAQIPSDGRYFLGVTDYYGGGGSGYGYVLSTGAFPVDETEPNNTAATATVVALGDTVVAGASAGDVDFFAVDVTADTYLGVDYLQVAQQSPMLEISMLGTDGSTVLTADTADAYSNRSTRFYLTAAGRYYVETRPLYGTTGLYAFRSMAIPTGPGDPVTVIAQGLGQPILAAAGLVGDAYVFDNAAYRLLHVSAEGDVSTLTNGIYVYAMAVDGFGDLLVSGSGSNGESAILRYASDGTQSTFATNADYPTALAVAPDGDVWAMACGPICPELRRYDPTGVLKDSSRTLVSGYRMAFSPSGVLHFIGGDGIVYRLTQSGPTIAIQDSSAYFESLAFDEDGYVYVADGFQGTIRLYDPSYNVVEAPFAAVNLGEPINLMFLRDASQAMTSRLALANGDWIGRTAYPGALLEVNPSGVRAVGDPAQPLLLRIARAPARTGRAGVAYVDTLRVVDPPGAVRWAVTGGSLPAGLALDSASGVIGGVPERKGTFTFSVQGTSGDRFGPGTFTIVIDEPTLVVTDVVNAVLGVADLLTEDEQRFLDLQGNHNGQLDIGDVRAYLAARGQLPALDRSATRKEER